MKSSTLVLFQYIIPVVTGLFSLFFPAALQMTLLVTSVFTVSQSYLFRQPGFRRFLNIHPMPEPPKPDPTKTVINVRARRKGQTGSEPPEEKKRGWAAVQARLESAYDDLLKKGKEIQGQYVPDEKLERRSAAEKKQAKAYEERRQREIAQTRPDTKQRRR